MGNCQKCGKELENEKDILCPECSSKEVSPANLFTDRAIAFIIDILVLAGISLGFTIVWRMIPILNRWSSLESFLIAAIAAIYLLVRDNLFDGQSIGKKIMGLKVYKKGTENVIDLNASLLRNLDLAFFGMLMAILKLIPVVFLGFFTTIIHIMNIILGIAALGILVLEAWFLHQNGSRLGDKLGSTVVVKEE